MKKKTIFIAAFLLILTGCSKSTDKVESMKSPQKTQAQEIQTINYYSYLDEIDMNNVQKSEFDFSLTYDKENPMELKNESSHIFLARVVSLEKADSPSNDEETPMDMVIPFTYGKLEVLQSFQGEVSGVVDFVRLGGIMKEKDLYKNEIPEVLEKRNLLRLESGRPPIEESEEYIDIRSQGDILLEAGGIYLFFARWDDEWKKYDLEGYEYGALYLEKDGKSVGKMRSLDKRIEASLTLRNLSNGLEYGLKDYLENELAIQVYD